MGLDHAAAGDGALAFDDEEIMALLADNAIGFEPARHGGEAVGFFHPQFLEANHFGAPLREGGGYGEDGIFVDHRGGAVGGDGDTLQIRVFDAQIGDVLAARDAAIFNRDIAAHFDQRIDQARAGGVHEDVFDNDLRAGH